MAEKELRFVCSYHGLWARNHRDRRCVEAATNTEQEGIGRALLRTL